MSDLTFQERVRVEKFLHKSGIHTVPNHPECGFCGILRMHDEPLRMLRLFCFMAQTPFSRQLAAYNAGSLFGHWRG